MWRTYSLLGGRGQFHLCNLSSGMWFFAFWKRLLRSKVFSSSRLYILIAIMFSVFPSEQVFQSSPDQVSGRFFLQAPRSTWACHSHDRTALWTSLLGKRSVTWHETLWIIISVCLPNSVVVPSRTPHVGCKWCSGF